MTELPEGWRQNALGSCADFVRGLTYKKPDASSKSEVGRVPLLRATNFDNGRLSLEDLLHVPENLVKDAQYLREGDTLIATSSGSISVVGKAVHIDHLDTASTFGAFCGVLRPSAVINPKYLYHYCCSPSTRAAWSEVASGTNINNLKPRDIEVTAIPTPSLDEQDEIVRILDTQLARLDAVLGAVQAARVKAAQFRRSLLQDAFNGQLTQPDPNRGDKYPIEWNRRPLGELALMSLGKMLDGKADSGLYPTPYLRNANIRWGNCDLSDIAVMDIPPDQLDRVSVLKGDLIVCEGGEPGRSAVWEGGPVAIQKALHRIRVRGDLVATYLQYLFEREFRGIKSHGLFTGTTIKHLPKDRFKTLGIPLPSLSEQSVIVRILDTQLARLDKALEVADRVELECGRLRRSLLQAAFSGELTREWRLSNG